MVNITDYKEPDEDATIKTLWEVEGQLDAKTDLDAEQIPNLTKLDTFGFITGSGIVKYHMRNYLVKKLSKQRKSREEFVNSIKSKREDFVNKGKGFFGSMMG